MSKNSSTAWVTVRYGLVLAMNSFQTTTTATTTNPHKT